MLTSPPAVIQDIPSHVRYKRAPEKVNAAARAILGKLFRGKPAVNADYFSSATLCAPRLWSTIRPTAPKLLADAAWYLPLDPDHPDAPKVKGRIIKTAVERTALARILISKYGNSQPHVRKPTTEEISAFWAVIAWDIEEPLYMVDIGKDHLIFNFMNKGGKLKILYVDKM